MWLSEHVYYVAISFKMTEWVEQWMCIKFCVKFEHPSAETILMIRKAVAMGNWVLAASSQQCSCLCIVSPAEFFGDTSNHPGDSVPYSLDLAPCDFWLFPKLKSPLKGKRFQTVDVIHENTMWHLMAIPTKHFAEYFEQWQRCLENCEVPRYLLWRRLRHHCPMYSCLLYTSDAADDVSTV